MTDFQAGIERGAAELGVCLNDRQLQQFLKYAELLQKWTRVYNLTAIRSPGEILTHHLIDSLAVVPSFQRYAGNRPTIVADVGSGAGLPGVILAICFPEWRVDCIDAVAKKSAFVQQVAGVLALTNLKGVHARVESVKRPYDLVTSRAFASLSDFVRLTQGCLSPGGVWAAMKGKVPDAEMAELPRDVSVFHMEQLTVPGLDAERCVVWMRRAAP